MHSVWSRLTEFRAAAPRQVPGSPVRPSPGSHRVADPHHQQLNATNCICPKCIRVYLSHLEIVFVQIVIYILCSLLVSQVTLGCWPPRPRTKPGLYCIQVMFVTSLFDFCLWQEPSLAYLARALKIVETQIFQLIFTMISSITSSLLSIATGIKKNGTLELKQIYFDFVRYHTRIKVHSFKGVWMRWKNWQWSLNICLFAFLSVII